MLLALILVPLVAALVVYAVPSDRVRPVLIVPVATAHLGAALTLLPRLPVSSPGGWLVLDSVGMLVLLVNDVVFLLCSVYAVGYLGQRRDRSNRVFTLGLLLFLSMTCLIAVSHHLGLMWIALEALTLTSAPLVYFNHNPRSIEATWKYLMIGSAGVALALLGSFFLSYSALAGGVEPSLLFEELVRDASHLSAPWLRAAFVLLFVGYGTKMGLAPVHTWKPDAYGEAPGLAGALLAGCATSCAFLAILRFYQIVRAADAAAFAQQIMVSVGLFSMLVGAAFMTRQKDYKRLLAYSSVEHMGILVLGVGLGGVGVFGALYHFVSNALAKGIMFLAAGNIHRAYGSKDTDRVQGAIRRVPASGALLMIGLFAVTGAPPFGTFISELTILRAAVADHRVGVAVLFLGLLFVVFLNMGSTILQVVQGKPSSSPNGFEDSALTVTPIAVFAGLVLLMGVYVPGPLESLLRDAAALVENVPVARAEVP
ncbi:MAG: hydrogenase [Deltaproteobacteria bacterium]|nr:hydrogenase [Deltaproteobacteria bacterium]